MLTPTSPSTSLTGAGQGSSIDTLLPAAGQELAATVRSVASSGAGGETFRIQVEVNSRLMELTTRAPLNQGDRILLQRGSGGELQIRLPAQAPTTVQGQTASAPSEILLQLSSTDRQLQQLLPLNSARTAQVISSEPASTQPPSSAPGSADTLAARPATGNPGAARSPLPTAHAPAPPTQPAPGDTGARPQTAAASATPTTTVSGGQVYSAHLQPPAESAIAGQRSPAAPVQPTGPATPATAAPPATPAAATPSATVADSAAPTTTTRPAAAPTPVTPAAATSPANPSAPPATSTTPTAAPGSTTPMAQTTPAPPTTAPSTTPAPPAANTTPATTPGSTNPTPQTTPAPPATAPATTPVPPAASAATPAAVPTTETGGQAAVSLRGQTLLQTLGQQPPPRTDSHLIGLSLNNQTFSLISPRPLLSGQQVVLTRVSDQQVSLQPLPPASTPVEDAGARQQMQQALREALPRQIPFADALNQMVQLSQGPTGRSQSAIGQLVQSMLSMFSVTPGSADAEQAIQRNLQQGGLLTESRLAQGGKSEQGAPADLKQQLGQLLKAAEKLPPDARQQLTRLVESLQARSTTQQISSLQAWKEQPDGTQERVYRLDLPIRQADHHDNAELTITEQRRRNSQGELETLWGAALHFDLEEYGPLDARLSLNEGWRLQIQFWAEETLTLRQIERRLNEFSDDLHRQGFLVESLQARQGRPSQPELTDIQRRLVDIHT